MRYVTYLVYIILYQSLVLGGTGYAVFVLGHSEWWFVFAAFLSGAAYSPAKWIHGQGEQK
jgi:hypothetical protein